MIKRGRLWHFGLVERKDDGDWVKRCMSMEIGGIRQRELPRKTWWDCVRDDTRSFGLTREVAKDKVEWRVRIKGACG